jgi:hypothetical protein
VKKDTFIVLENISLGNSPRRDFFGILRNEFFTIWKRKGIFDLNSLGFTLDGKILTNENNLTLILQLSNYWIFYYIKTFLFSIIIAFFFYFVLMRFLHAQSIILFILLFVGVYFLYSNLLKNIWNEQKIYTIAC